MTLTSIVVIPWKYFHNKWPHHLPRIYRRVNVLSCPIITNCCADWNYTMNRLARDQKPIQWLLDVRMISHVLWRKTELNDSPPVSYLEKSIWMLFIRILRHHSRWSLEMMEELRTADMYDILASSTCFSPDLSFTIGKSLWTAFICVFKHMWKNFMMTPRIILSSSVIICIVPLWQVALFRWLCHA